MTFNGSVTQISACKLPERKAELRENIANKTIAWAESQSMLEVGELLQDFVIVHDPVFCPVIECGFCLNFTSMHVKLMSGYKILVT